MLKKFNAACIEVVAQELIRENFSKHRIFAFIGPLGVGKTTLIKEILKQRGIQESVDSPTFGYVRSYSNQQHEDYQHFDLYRIDSLESFIGLGFDEYLYNADFYCFIEWPEVIEQLLKEPLIKEKTCFVTLSYDPLEQETRTIVW